jgi:hypothetical protein
MCITGTAAAHGTPFLSLIRIATTAVTSKAPDANCRFDWFIISQLALTVPSRRRDLSKSTEKQQLKCLNSVQISNIDHLLIDLG